MFSIGDIVSYGPKRNANTGEIIKTSKHPDGMPFYTVREYARFWPISELPHNEEHLRLATKREAQFFQEEKKEWFLNFGATK